MKKLAGLLSLLALVLIITTPAYALTASESAKMKRDEFRANLAAIRDAKKQALVEKIDQRISQINANRTAIMLRHLTKIEEVLARIETRVNTLATDGKDVATVRTAITAARTAIAASRTAVNAQAAKTYVINITTEDKLGSAVSSTRTTFAKDLQAAHQTVVAARKSVRDVLKALAKIVGEKLTTTTEE